LKRLRTFLFTLCIASTAQALDKQGAAHAGGGGGSGASDGFGVSGSVMLGVSLYNPSYAARPDNTGLALLRYAAHADIDLIGHKLSIPIDVNLFTDRMRDGALAMVPTEFDVIAGVTSTWEAAKGSFEFGLRLEQDRPLDRGSFRQEYIDLRVRYIYSVRSFAPTLSRALKGGDIRGWIGQGTFLYNPTYAARPDNTDLALFRAMAHAEVSAFEEHVAFGLDTTWFTRREASHFTPTELDFTAELIFRLERYEFHLAYERDMPVDRKGLAQEFVFASISAAFDFKPHRE
jgi:hypothetical protein